MSWLCQTCAVCDDAAVRIGKIRERSPASSYADDAVRATLVAALGAEHVHSSPIDTALYARDASVIDEGFTTVVCFPATTSEVQACVRAARSHGRPFVARGSGTGLAGGAVPCGGAVVITTTRMDTIHEVDLASGVAWVGPGVLNLDVTRHLAPYGVHFAPDPSSQQSCSIGGNVANNSGGPHCLAYGVTSAHVVALEVVLPDGEIAVLGGLDPEPTGLDLRGAFVGSEGTMGIATKIAVRLTPNPPTIRTMLIDFESVAEAGATVSGIIAAGVVPAAILLVEVDGLPGGVDTDTDTVAAIARANRARTIRIAADETERAALWKGRKSAFGAIARIKPNYYLHDTVIPRTRLVEVLERVYAIAQKYDLLVMNVFHAGDGNLHPLLVYDAREPGTTERVYAAGKEIVEASLAVGGVLSGEHGIGLEKRAFMHLQFSEDDLEHQAKLRRAFDPFGLANPGKVLPSGASCGDVFALSPEQQRAMRDGGAWL